MIRRSIAGLILGPSLLLGSLAWSGYVALRTVFDADRSREVAEELLENDEVRSQLAENLGTAIEGAVPAEVALTSEQVEQVAAEVLEDPAVEELIVTAFASAHAAFLGEGNVPQTLDLTPAADAFSSAVVDVAPAVEPLIPESPTLRVTLPTGRIPNAGPIRDFLQRAVPILAAIAISGALLALLATSDRTSVLTKAGIWAPSTAAFYLLLGFGVPWLLRRYAPEQAEVLAALVTALLRTTLVPSLVLALCGAGLIAAAILWPGEDARREQERPEARPSPAATTPRRPAWPGPVPQPLVYPEPDWRRPMEPGSGPPAARARVDPTVVAPPAATPVDAAPAAAPPVSSRPRVPRQAAAAGLAASQPGATGPASGQPPAARHAARPAPASPHPDRPPPLPTVASTSPRRPPAGSDPGDADHPTPSPSRPPDPSPGRSGRLPTKEHDDRPAKWRPPRWVEGHGWVLDPDDPKAPPPNARFVEGVGYVVPGPPPRPRPGSAS